MIFGSIEFLLYFLPIFMLVYYLAPKKYKNIVLVAGSLIFYAYGDPVWLALLIVSVVVNYFVGLHLSGKGGLTAAVAVNVAVLLFMKCVRWELGFPLGLSFYTFQTLSYLIDVYRKEFPAEKNIVKYAVYITGFMQLVSGPIVRYGEMREALEDRECSAETYTEGFQIFIMGLAAKVLLADRLGILWNDIQVRGFEAVSTPLAWVGAFAFSLQLYFDFYGYSVMAVGLGRMMGFDLPENFRHPYLSGSVREFYRRWHMTLGRWFCRYVYIPLGGSRKGEFVTVCNLIVVWMLTAVWHGNTWNYLIWGMFLCVLILLERFVSRKVRVRIPLLGHLYLWIVIPVSWMCFAIPRLSDLKLYLGRMFGLIPPELTARMDWQKALTNYGGLLVVAAVCCTPVINMVYDRLKNNRIGKLLLCVLFWMCVAEIRRAGANTFLYFSY